MDVKKMFGAISAALVLSCGIFVGTALAQDDDLWGDSYSSPTEMSMPEPDPAPGWEPLETPASDKPGKAAKQKPAKPPKAAKPPKEARPKTAPSAGDDRTLNVFVNTGAAFGIGGQLEREVNTAGHDKDSYINMGQGLRFEAGAGYMATPNLETRFSVDLNFGLFAPTVEQYNAPLNQIEEYSYFSWGVKIMAVPQFEVLELFDMYVGAGMSLNFAYGDRDSSNMEPSGPGNSPTRVNSTFDRQFSLFNPGFCGLFGFILPLSDEIDFLGELQFESKRFILNKEKVTSSDKATNNWPSNIDYKKDDRQYAAPPKYSGSNWGLRIGVRYWISL